MKRIDGSSQNVEQKQHAQANKFQYASPKDGADSSEEAKSEIPRQPKDKAHCFCPIIAKEHGENAAVILQGLGYKVAKSKKVRDSRKWHFDTLEALEKRWPYLRDSGIHGIISKLAVDEHVFKGCYNKAGFDPTTWYSVTNEFVKRAMDEEGKIWFDVPAAVQCHSIIAGTIYQNIRYHLLIFLADNPEFRDVPFYKVNKAALARVLNRSHSTIKREFKELLKHKFIAVNPKQSKEYTICNAADLVVPEGMKNKASKSGSSTQRNGSFMEMGIGSSTEVTGSFTEQSGSFMEKNGSYSDSNTHYKPFERPFQNTHSLTAAPSVCVGAQAADAAKDIVDQEFSKSSGSPTVSVKEDAVIAGNNTTMPYKALQGIQDIRRQKDRVMGRLTESDIKVIVKDAFELTHCFVREELDTPTLLIGWQSFNQATIISAVSPCLAQFWHEHGTYSGWTADTIEASFLQSLELVLGGFLLCGGDWKVVHPHFKDTWNHVWDIYQEIPEAATRADAPAGAKADMLLSKISFSNKNGWETYSDGEVEFTVSGSTTVRKAAVLFFEDNADLSAHAVWHVLADCVEVHKLNETPKGFDPFWKARKGIKPAFLFQYWEDIKAELAAAGKLAS